MRTKNRRDINRRDVGYRDVTVTRERFNRGGGSLYSLYGSRLPIVPTTTVDNQSNVASFVSYVNGITDFSTDTRDEILENLYIYEPTVASAADSFGVMVRDSVKYFSHREVKKPKTIIEKFKEKMFSTSINKIEEMIDVANEIGYDLNVPDLVETLATLAFVKGTVFIRKNKNKTITILPNPNVTIIDRLDRIDNTYSNVGSKSYIMEANYLIIDEGLPTQEVLNKDEFVILRFRDTPLFVQDGKLRITYGIYSISPLRRALIPIWYKRIAMANDALWRAKVVPREHHTLSAESFSTEHYPGRTKAAAMAAAQTAAASALAAYKDKYTTQSVDQAFITLDTTQIKMIEPSSTSYMRPNELIDQMNQEIYSAINMPQSVVRGTSGSNYASEIIISSYTTTKIKQMAHKISRIIIDIMKERLLEVDSKYPVDQLDVKIAYTLASNRLENAKISQVLASMGICYTNELREMNDLDDLEDKFNVLIDTGSKINPATDEMKEEMEKEMENGEMDMIGTDAQVRDPSLNAGGQKVASDGKVNYPTTSHSANTQPSDSGDALYNKATKTK